MRRAAPACLPLLALALFVPPARGDGPARMKFNEVREVAPGVFFRYSAISATDKSVVFGGSNNIWVLFKDYVVVFDANFPEGAGEVLAAVRKTTKLPVRFVIDSHHHGDHAYGNAVFAKAGATVVSQANCARLLRELGPRQFAEAGKPPTGRKDVAASFLKVPDLVFDDKLVLDDGTQRVELLFLGHCHTAGDCFAYLPKQKILCTGDACVNGAFNYTGDADTAAWIRNLEKAQQLDVKLVCPGHGLPAGRDLLATQRRWFVDLRAQVKKGIAAGKDVADIRRGLDIPWYKKWTGVPAGEQKENVEHVYDELTGRFPPWELTEDLGLFEGPSPTKDSPGWTKPRRIVVPNLMPARLAELKRVAPEVQFVPVKTAEDAAREAADADAVVGFCTPEVVKAGAGRLRWIQLAHAGVEKDLSPEVVKSPVVLTNASRIDGPNVADHALALLLCLTRGVQTPPAPPPGDFSYWGRMKVGARPQELRGKTMLVVGLGGIGTQVARRAHAFGMRVLAVDPRKDLRRPDFVFSLGGPDRLPEKLRQADVVVLACPLTAATRGMIGAAQLKAMKPTAYLINVARGGLVRTPDLVAALKGGEIGGAGLDVIDPEPLPNDSPLWKMANVVISPHVAGLSPEARDRQWRLWRENVRRFAAGERLLCVVDKGKGY